MGGATSAGNSVGFKSQLTSGSLPNQDHISYEGVFNELTFKIGPKAKNLLEVHSGICRSAYEKSIYDKSINDYLALFLKCQSDGQPRDSRKLNAVLVVDVSGSMECSLSKSDSSTRLSLTKEAIKMFVSKLRDDDSFGLVKFSNVGQTLIQNEQKRNLDLQTVFSIIDSLQAGGGTELACGFQEGAKNIRKYLQNNVKDFNSENRIVMLTDVNDNFGPCGPILNTISESNIHTTIIGISEEFQSMTCEALKQVKGFNYFCAVEVNDLKKYLFDNFDYTFFPTLYDVEIKLEGENIRRFDVYGTPDRQKVFQNNNFAQKGITNYLITRIPTLFPSQLQRVGDEVLTHGGLILVKIIPRQQLKELKGKILVSYSDLSSNRHEFQIALDFELPLNQQFYSCQSLEEAIRGFYFVSQMKQILKQLQDVVKADKQPDKFDKYLQSLESLKVIAPEAKLDEVSLMQKLLESQAMIVE